MMNFLKRLGTIDLFLLLFLCAIFLDSCKKEPAEKKYVAKVNSSYLTRDELDSIYNSSYGTRYKNEIIRNWITNELLYQEAQKKGLLGSDKFKEILNNSKKKLAASFLINDFFENVKLSADNSELENFYKNNPDEFKLNSTSFVLNKIVFNDEEKALIFRSAAIENGWDGAVSLMREDSSIISESSKDFLSEYEVQPASVLRVVKELYPNEISIVMKSEDSKYSVIQLVQTLDKGILPPFDLIQEDVRKAYLFQKRELIIKDYIKQLYSKNDIEVKN